MILKEHKKHAKLARPTSGNFGRNEWAIVGAPCDIIKQLAADVITALSPQYKCAYADSSHNEETTQPIGRLANGAILEYTDQLHSQQFSYHNQLAPYALKEHFAGADLILTNGNHHPARQQVVIMHKAKQASLQKRLKQLTNIALFVLDDADIFDFIKNAIPNWGSIPVCRLEETERIVEFFQARMHQAKPVLKGLVLAGGKSTRMGQDKGTIKWFEKEQRYYIADILKKHCDEVLISCRADQQQDIAKGYQTLTDTFIDLGPFGAILSAFREDPDSAWLVVACDMPLVDENAIKHLIAHRDSSAVATTYKNDLDGFPEPLITIWEPKSYPVLLGFLGQGYSCPRKVLINSDTTVLQPQVADVLTNVNTPVELETIKLRLSQK